MNPLGVIFFTYRRIAPVKIDLARKIRTLCTSLISFVQNSTFIDHASVNILTLNVKGFPFMIITSASTLFQQMTAATIYATWCKFHLHYSPIKDQYGLVIFFTTERFPYRVEYEDAFCNISTK